MKKFLVILLSIVVVVYLIFSLDFFSDLSDDNICEEMEVVVQDSLNAKFVTKQDIIDLVNRFKLNPVGKQFKDINTLQIRDSILSNRLVETAEVFSTPKGSVVINIKQRQPILRVISNNSGSYYVDKDRRVMPVSGSFSLYVPIATGNIDEDMAKGELYDFALFLNGNPDWDALIEQIVVNDNKEIELVPRAGDFRILLGQFNDYRAKLDRFMKFSDKVLNVVGWNRYSVVNLKYDNQVVCTKAK
ncbi:MAG: cell division protein FtsQ/DivIB [Fermentimonas sp.]|jgi:cell division protein FtsQ